MSGSQDEKSSFEFHFLISMDNKLDEFHWMVPVTAWMVLVAHRFQDWQSSVIPRTASLIVRKINPLFG